MHPAIMWMGKIALNVSTEEPSSAVNVTTMEKPSSVPSHRRTSSAGSHRRRFFRSCKLQQWKNLLPWLPTEEVLLRDRTEESSSTVVTLTAEEPSSVPSHGKSSSARSHGRRFFRCCYFQLWKNLLPWVNLFFLFLNFWIILYLPILFCILYFTITKFNAYLIRVIITK